MNENQKLVAIENMKDKNYDVCMMYSIRREFEKWILFLLN